MIAQQPLVLTVTVRVTRIRSTNRKGCVAFGHRVDVELEHNDRSTAIVIAVPTIPAPSSMVEVGAIYEVYGESSVIHRDHGGYKVSEIQVDAQYIRLVRPSGSQLIQWLADNAPGIGEVKATKLWDAFQGSLYDILDCSNHDAISKIVPSKSVRLNLFSAWLESGDAKTLRFVQDKVIPLDLARKAIKFHKSNTIQALQEDPYRLLSFCGGWYEVDKIACERFSIGLDDTRRLGAALEEALYRVAEKGDTCAKISDLLQTFSKLLAPHSAPTSALAKALLQGKATGQFIVRDTPGGDVMLHAPGTYIMERSCAEFIMALLLAPEGQQPLSAVNVSSVIADFEQLEREHLKLDTFALNEAQHVAVNTSLKSRFSIITGGGGVGKTTVLKALYQALDRTGRPRFQMALSGRATARLIEATGEEALTIAGFLRNVGDKEMGLAPIIVIDEASMLDLVTFYRLVQKLPSESQMILVGDPYQLPPIGAGLILHVLCGMAAVPITELVEIKRQAKDSSIPLATRQIRDGQSPTFSPSEHDEVVFLPCIDEQIIPTVLRLYEQDSESTQILSATKSCRFAGVDALNRICHVQYGDHSRQLLVENQETGEVEATGLSVGDLVMYTANDWARNLQNGSLGKLEEVFDQPRSVDLGGDNKSYFGTALGMARFEGVKHYILDTDIDSLELAYSITVHKAQGSQFRRVIIPVRKSRILDRTFVYTAATRAQVQVVFVGDLDAVKDAIANPPKAFSRQVGLRALLESVDLVDEP